MKIIKMKELIQNINKFNKKFNTDIQESIPFHCLIHTNKPSHYKQPDKLAYEVEFICNTPKKITFARVHKVMLFLMDENTYITDYLLIIPNEELRVFDSIKSALDTLQKFYNLSSYQTIFNKIKAIELIEDLKCF